MPICRAVLLLAAIGAAPIAIAQALLTAAQSNPTTAPMPGYEVISVKLDNPDRAPQMWASLQPDGYSAKGISLIFLLMYAYKITPDYRIIGAPAWWNDNRYDIQAKVGDADLPASKNSPTLSAMPWCSRCLRNASSSRFTGKRESSRSIRWW